MPAVCEGPRGHYCGACHRTLPTPAAHTSEDCIRFLAAAVGALEREVERMKQDGGARRG